MAARREKTVIFNEGAMIFFKANGEIGLSLFSLLFVAAVFRNDGVDEDASLGGN